MINKVDSLESFVAMVPILKAEVPADFYGFEFTGTATPVHAKDGRVMGGIAVQLRRQTELREIADHSRTRAGGVYSTNFSFY